MKAIRISCTGAAVVPYTQLVPFQGDLKSLSELNYIKLRDKILRLGYSEPISVWRHQGNFYILNGHQRLRTIRQMVEEEGFTCPPLPVNWVEATDWSEAKRKVLSLTSQFGEIEKQGLYEFMHEAEITADELEDFVLPEIDVPKFTAEYFDGNAGIDENYDKGKDDIEDEVPDVTGDPICKYGDLWQLGDHRLLCGDSTIFKDVQRLMNGEKAVMWQSDPPYGINHVEVANEKGQAKGYDKIKNDDLQDEELRKFIFSSIKTSLPFMKKGFSFYMWHAMKMQAYFSQAAAAAAAGILFHRQIIWVKPNFVFGRGQYHWRHELCLMGWLKGDIPPFYGEKNQSTVWEIGKENDKIHPTQKPVAIWEAPIKNHMKKGEIVYEPFCGSGSQIIAAEKNGVRCFSIEIDPKYCNVIIHRWEQYTGEKAQKVEDAEA